MRTGLGHGPASTPSRSDRTVIWATSVTASSLASHLGRLSGAERTAPGGSRSPISQLPGHPEVFVISDMVRVRSSDGRFRSSFPVSRPLRCSKAATLRRPCAPASTDTRRLLFGTATRGISATIGGAGSRGRHKGLAKQLHQRRAHGLLVHLGPSSAFRTAPRTVPLGLQLRDPRRGRR